MAKTKISEYSSTANSNTDIASINIDEGCAPSGINNAIRALMAQIHDLYAGTSGDTWPVTAGGTGSGTASGARTNLGLAIGTDVQAYNAALAAIAANNGTNMMKNRIINGAMVIDQRNAGAAVTLTAAGYVYPVDRWFAGRPSGTSGAIAQRVSGSYVGGYALRVQRNSGDTSTSLLAVGQVLESANCIGFAGNSITRSFRARCGANFSGASSQITARVGTGNGTDQSKDLYWNNSWTGQSNTDAAITLTTSWQTFSTTITAGASVNQVGMTFFYTPSGTAGANDWFEIEEVQLEKGSTATSFDYRPYGAELALCQRYYQKFTGSTGTYTKFGVGVVVTSTACNGVSVAMKVQMRTAPSISGIGVDIYDGSAASNITSYNNLSSPEFISFDATCSGGGLTVGRPGMMGAGATTDYLDASAEL